MSNKPPSKSNRGWFPKGRSGNEGGRPPRTRAPQDPLLEIFSEPIRVNGPDGSRDMSQEEAMEWATFRAALTGTAAAIKDMTEMLTEYQGTPAEHAPGLTPQPIELVAAQHPSNADEALLLLGIAAPYAESMGLACIPLMLEPWAAQAAISRRRGAGRLSDGQREGLKRFIRDFGSLRWPRGTDK
jgi:hypothetical protein